MHVATHFLASWSLAEALPLSHRDRALVTWAGCAADLDGLGLFADLAMRAFNHPGFYLYHQFHHVLLHGLFGAILIPGLLCLLARGRRLAVFGWGFLAVHVHLLCDLVGSRGPLPVDIWPVDYLQPFSGRLSLAWSGQWRIDGWPNVLITALLLGFVLYRAGTVGHSPLSLFSRRAHAALVEAVQRRWPRKR